MGEVSVPLDVRVQTCIEGLTSLSRHWRSFTVEQRKLADALDQELVRLMRKVNADDYFGALGLSPISNFSIISAAADCIVTRFSEERVRVYGLHLKEGGWKFKARKIDALVRHALDTLRQIKREDRLDAYAANYRSALIAETASPATAPNNVVDHQGERTDD